MVRTALGKKAAELYDSMTEENVDEVWNQYLNLVNKAEASKDEEAFKEICDYGEIILMFKSTLRSTKFP